MITLKSIVRLALSAVTAAALLAASPAVARPPVAPRLWDPRMLMVPRMIERHFNGGGICDPRAVGLAQWRFDRMENAVKPTEAQRLLLAELKATSSKARESISASCPREVPSSPVARLEVMEKRLNVMLEAVESVRPALDAFYSSLSEEQRSKLSSVSPDGWGWLRWL